MVKYDVEVIRPGVTEGVSGVERKYTEAELRDAVDSLDGAQVTNQSRSTNVDAIVGRVVDVWYRGGVQCTVDIFDNEMAQTLDENTFSLAPSLEFEPNEDDEDVPIVEDIKFRYLFAAPVVSELVGLTERVE
jgi:hypothetical protein